MSVDPHDTTAAGGMKKIAIGGGQGLDTQPRPLIGLRQRCPPSAGTVPGWARGDLNPHVLTDTRT